MTFYEWTPELDVKVADMNGEHQKLIDKMNFLYTVNEEGKDKSVVLQALEDLAAYTVKHFANEEAYMESIGFDGLATHKIIHQQLLAQFSEHLENYKNGDSSQLGEEFFRFLAVWLTSHIKGIDTKYGAAKAA